MIDAAARAAFACDGFVVLNEAIDAGSLAMLRQECERFVAQVDRELQARGSEVSGITHRGRRYFIAGRYRHSDRMPAFVFGGLMRAITTAFLGETVYLFNEQWVVKGAERGMKFAWHQDSGYVNFRDPGNSHAPYLTCWCALDDMTRANGTIAVMPHGRVAEAGTVLPHRHEPGSNDLVGYESDDPGVLVEAPAGSVVVFSSTTLHRSGANSTARPRRAYLTQYSAEQVRATNGKLWGQAVPFVANGRCVYDHAADVERTRHQRQC